MRVERHLWGGQRNGGLAAGLPERTIRQPIPLARHQRGGALEVGQGEGGPPVATVVRAEQREERRVLGDGQQLAVAQRPAERREVPAEHSDLAYEWVGHCSSSSPAPASCAKERCPRVRLRNWPSGTAKGCRAAGCRRR